MAESLLWLDPCMDASLFHRDLSAVRPEVSITLVTCEPAHKQKRDRQRWQGFLEVSRLFANERSPKTYRLMTHDRFHDRWVVLDGKRIHNLGRSAKDAGQRDYFTIATVKLTPENLSRIHSQIDQASEWFGPGTPEHQ